MTHAARTLLTAAIMILCLGSANAQNNSLQVKLGGFFPRADGEFWTESEEVFTLDTDDFRDFTLGLTYTAGLGKHFEAGINVDFYDSTVSSAYRDYVDDEGYPIVHDTHLRMIPLTFDIRIVPSGRRGASGTTRQGGGMRPVLYFGGGIGVNLFRYEEVGSFIDFDASDLPVVFDRFLDDGAAFQAHALLGLDLPAGRTWSLIFEGRYTWSEAELGDDFEGFGTIDLSGAWVFGGISWRF